MKFDANTIQLGGYAVIIILLLVLVFMGLKVECRCDSAKSARASGVSVKSARSPKNARAPFHNMPNPANMVNQTVTQEQQNLMNIQGCKQIDGIWKTRSNGTGVCQNWNRPGVIPLE